MSRSPRRGSICLIILGMRWYLQNIIHKKGFVVPHHRLVQPRSRILRRCTYILYVGIIIICFHIQIPGGQIEKAQRAALVQIVLDVSLSMSAQDISPNRRTAAQQGLKSFLERSAPGPTALITFSGIPLTTAPWTSSQSGLASLIGEINLGDYPLVSIDFLGTAGGDALAVGIESLVIKSQQIQKEQKSDLPKIIIRITDGYSNKGINPESIIPYLQEYGISVWALGIGDTNTVIGKDHQGSPVTTPIEFDVLEKIAQHTDGFFVKAESREEIKTFFDQAESRLLSHTETVSEKIFFQINTVLIPILIALLLIIIGIRIGLAVRGVKSSL